jgi:hypothetical protein
LPLATGSKLAAGVPLAPTGQEYRWPAQPRTPAHYAYKAYCAPTHTRTQHVQCAHTTCHVMWRMSHAHTARSAHAAPAARSGPRFVAPWFLLLAGYENLTAPLFALARQCKAEVTAAAPGGPL